MMIMMTTTTMIMMSCGRLDPRSGMSNVWMVFYRYFYVVMLLVEKCNGLQRTMFGRPSSMTVSAIE